MLEDNINASRYIKEVLEPKMLPSARDLFGATGDFIFQQDGAPCHTARVCTSWFQQHNVQLLTWPGNSPDLNPIENLWSRLKRLVMQKRPPTEQQDQAYRGNRQLVVSSYYFY